MREKSLTKPRTKTLAKQDQPSAPAEPQAPVVSHHQTHKFSFDPDKSYQACVCGAEQNLVLRNGASVRLYRSRTLGTWEPAIEACPQSAGVIVAPTPPTKAPPTPASSVVSGLEKALRGAYPEAFAPEIIQGRDVEEMAKMVTLEDVCSPVLSHRDSRSPVDVTDLGGGQYRIYDDAYHDGASGVHDVSVDVLKVMRARYLLARGAILQAMPTMTERERENVTRGFFKGKEQWFPPAGSPLATMGRGPITIPRVGNGPIDFEAVMKALTTPGGAIPTVCPTLAEEPQ
jgi:hypothetical protein